MSETCQHRSTLARPSQDGAGKQDSGIGWQVAGAAKSNNQHSPATCRARGELCLLRAFLAQHFTGIRKHVLSGAPWFCNPVAVADPGRKNAPLIHLPSEKQFTWQVLQLSGHLRVRQFPQLHSACLTLDFSSMVSYTQLCIAIQRSQLLLSPINETGLDSSSVRNEALQA